MGPLFVFLFVLFGIALGALIPAFLSKVLMQFVFGRRVSLGMVLLAMVLGTVFMVAVFVGLMWYAEGTINLESLEAFETQMTPAETGLAWLFGFLLQLLLLSLLVSDEHMELIAAWKWALVLVLQYVVILVVALAIGLLLAATAQAEAFPITEMV